MTLIVIEGIDGTGKTTQVDLISKRMQQAGYNTRTFKDPGDTLAGEAIRKIVKDKTIPLENVAQILMFTAARFQLAIEWLAETAFRRDTRYDILDRWWPSTYAYQSVKNPNLKNLIMQLNDLIMRDYTLPDIAMPHVVILDAPPELSLQRIRQARGLNETVKDRFEDVAYLAKVRENYIELSKIMGFPLVDATQPLEDVTNDIWMELQSMIKPV